MHQLRFVRRTGKFEQVVHLNGEGHTMPAFTFEKISPPVRRAPAASTPKKPRGLISQMIDRLAERRARRALQGDRAISRDEKQAE